MSIHELSLKQLDDKLNAQISKEASDFESLSGDVTNSVTGGIPNRVNRLFNPDFSLVPPGATLTSTPGLGWSHAAGSISYSVPSNVHDSEPNAGTPRIAILGVGCILQSPMLMMTNGANANPSADTWMTLSMLVAGNGSINVSAITAGGLNLGNNTVNVAAGVYSSISFAPFKVTGATIGIRFRIQIITGSVNISHVNVGWGTQAITYPNGDFFDTSYFKKTVDSLDSRTTAVETGKAALNHGHAISEVTNLQSSLDSKAALNHGHAISEVTNLQSSLDSKSNNGHIHQDLIDSKHNRTGDEVHTGFFKVTQAPATDNDVIRLVDFVNRSTTQNASLVNFWLAVPDAWGSGALIQNIPTTNRKSSSGNDIIFSDSDTHYLEVNTAGYYEFLGVGYSQSNWDHHDFVVKIFKRPNGTTGSSDVTIFDSGETQEDGSTNMSIFCVDSAVPGDRYYFASVGTRSLGCDMRCSYIGKQAATRPISINNTDISWMAADGQVYPKIVNVALSAINQTGDIVWSITGGTAASFSTLSGPSTATVNLPAVGTYSLNLRAIDSIGGIADKSINLSLIAYAVVPIVITTTVDQSYTASTYPYIARITLTSTGGTAPITWSLVGGNLPGQTISGSNYILGTVSDFGTWTSTVRATDAIGQWVEKTFNVTVDTYEPPVTDPGDPVWCFEASTTYVLMADKSAKLLSEIMPGEYVFTISEFGHNNGLRKGKKAKIMDVTRKEGTGSEENALIVNGISCTPGHSWATVKEGSSGFTPARDLTDHQLIQMTLEGRAVLEDVEVTSATSPVNIHANLGTDSDTYCVGSSPAGPWYLVHNAGHIVTPSY